MIARSLFMRLLTQWRLKFYNSWKGATQSNFSLPLLSNRFFGSFALQFYWCFRKGEEKTRVKEKESHFQLPNTIDGCGAYLVRASSSHTSTLATTTATNVKKAKQLTLHVPHFFFCVHFLKSMQDYNEKFSNPTFCMGRFFVYFTLKISCRNSSTIEKLRDLK